LTKAGYATSAFHMPILCFPPYFFRNEAGH
jgi:hypothetical protein